MQSGSGSCSVACGDGGSGRGRGRGREGGAGSACGVRQQRVEGERASWQGGVWGWQWVGAAVVAEVGEEVEAVVAREWKQGLARGSGEGGGPVNWTWCCCYLHAALSTGAAELLSSRSSAHLRRTGWGVSVISCSRRVLLACCIVASRAHGSRAYLGGGAFVAAQRAAGACGSWRAAAGRGGSTSEL